MSDELRRGETGDEKANIRDTCGLRSREENEGNPVGERGDGPGPCKVAEGWRVVPSFREGPDQVDDVGVLGGLAIIIERYKAALPPSGLEIR